MKADRLLDVVAVALGDAVHQGQIFFVDFALFELDGQPAMGHLVLDDDQQAGRVAVEAVDDARPIFAGEGRQRVVVKLKCIHQRPSPVAAGGVGDHVGRLVDDRQKLVFVDDLERDVFGLGRGVGQIGKPDADHVARADAVRGLDHASVHQDGVGVDDLLDHAPGVVGEPAGEVGVEPLAFGSRL